MPNAAAIHRAARAAALYLLRTFRAWLPPRPAPGWTLRPSATAPAQLLLALLSAPNHDALQQRGRQWMLRLDAVCYLLDTRSPEALLRSLPRGPARWNWAPLLHSVAQHRHSLQEIVLLPSPLSAPAAPALLELLQGLLNGVGGRSVRLRLCDEHPDYGEPAQVAAAVARALQPRRRGSGPAAPRHAPHLVVQIGGGSKVASAAAAMAAVALDVRVETLEAGRCRQYCRSPLPLPVPALAQTHPAEARP
jgi:hypothetical protein